MNAVHSEYNMRTQNDSRRTFWLEIMTRYNPSHPLCHFGSGNIETLKEIPEKLGLNIREELLQFHKEKYSSNIMALCVIGRESLDELETNARELFSPVVNKNVKLAHDADLGNGQSPFKPEAFGTITYVVPLSESRKLKFSFPMPGLSKVWRCKPEDYLSHLIGHEGKGSLLSALKNKEWATDISSYDTGAERWWRVFAVEVDLTPRGMEHAKEIGAMVFAYIQMLQASPVEERIWMEVQKVQKYINISYNNMIQK